MEKSENLTLLASIMAVQAEIKRITNDAVNPHFKSSYATLDHIWDIVRPTLTKAGLVVTNGIKDGNVVTALTHVKTGEYIESSFPVPQGIGPQQIGSALTYARRYNLCALLQLTTGDDDDGERASAAPAQQAQTERPKPSQTAPRVQTHGPDFCPFGNHDRWSSMDTARLESAMKCTDAKITDAHRDCIAKILAERKRIEMTAPKV